MRALFVICGLAMSVSALAQNKVSGTEGRLKDAPTITLDDKRVSVYTGAPAGAESDLGKAKSGLEKQYAASEMKDAMKEAMKGETQLESKRAPSVALSEKSSWFRIYDAGSFLRRDRDGDGYHSEFEIRFDADSYIGDARVYAKLYLRRVGDTGGWTHYFTTDDFWIYGTSGTDDYYVRTTLDDGFPTGDYDVLVDLYESGYSGVVATITAYDDVSLASLPLEERGLDTPIQLPGYSIQDVSTTLQIDDDKDGYYSKFKISFDPDADSGPAYLYAIVWIRPQGGDWIKEHESDDFLVDTSGTADVYSFTADWVSGYPTAKYDVQLDLHDATTGLLVASAGSERPEFSRIPLEDQANDRIPNSPVVIVGGGSTSSHEHGGGSFSLLGALALGGLLIARAVIARLQRRQALMQLVATRYAKRVASMNNAQQSHLANRH